MGLVSLIKSDVNEKSNCYYKVLKSLQLIAVSKFVLIKGFMKLVLGFVGECNSHRLFLMIGKKIHSLFVLRILITIESYQMITQKRVS